MEGFEVRDRRHFLKDDPEEKPQENVQEPLKEADTTIPVTFSSFILSLATSTLMHLGQGGKPQEGAGAVSLPLARQIIDLISLLEEKTKGNLTGEEDEMVSQTLFALRMKFVEIEKKVRH